MHHPPTTFSIKIKVKAKNQSIFLSMDFNLKQWQNHESENQETLKQPRLFFDFNSSPSSTASGSVSESSASDFALPLFVSEPTNKLSDSTTPSATTKFSRMQGSGYFSFAQWQELELQALIYRHFIAGAPVPPELLHIVKKSIINSPSSAYYFSHPFQQYPQCQQAFVQSGYWGRAAMDPEPGRCRRTDGKKWRCSRDVVAGQKYCERHVHRGRSRSRKPVEIPTPSSTPGGKQYNTQTLAKMAGHAGAGPDHFSLSGHSPSIDILHLNQRPSESRRGPLEAQQDVSGDGKSSGQILRHFFDDWPRQLQDGDNAGNSSTTLASATSLSISMPGNPSSDFSLKLSTGNDYNSDAQVSNVERSLWGTNRVTSMGGPLAEALRSTTTNSSPTSVLHQLSRGSTSEASYVTS